MKKTEQIYRDLKKLLDENFYPANSRFPSESSLADQYNVNKMTMNKVVSMLVNDGYLVRGVRGAGTRVVERRFALKGTIAFFSPLTKYTVEVLQGVYRECARSNFAVIVESPEIEDFPHRVQLLRANKINGVISATLGAPLLPEDMFSACVDCDPTMNMPENTRFINSDNYLGGKEIMSKIIERGHREILIFSMERFNRSPDAPNTPRVRGFYEAMQSVNINKIEERTFFSANNSLADAEYFLQNYLQRFPKTTLIACDSDPAAELIHTAALKQGLDCPGKIALTGFGNVSKLPIATVDQNPIRQGELAARSLIEGLSGNWANVPLDNKVTTSVVNLEHIPIKLHSS